MEVTYKVVAVMSDESVVSRDCETDIKVIHAVAEYLQSGAKELRIRVKKLK